jgi:Sulfotransferase family
MIALVLGLRRSGTSLIAQLLHEMGVVMGQRWCTTDDDWNPSGNFEDYDFVAAQHQMTSMNIDENGRITNCDPTILAAWHKLIVDRCACYKNWGVKNFGLPFLLMEFAAISPDKDIRVILCRRPFNKCILSWWRMAHAKYTLGQMIEKSGAFLFNLEQAKDCWIKNGGKIFEIDYEAVVINPHKEVPALAAFCGLEVPAGLENIVDSRLRHF